MAESSHSHLVDVKDTPEKGQKLDGLFSLSVPHHFQIIIVEQEEDSSLVKPTVLD